MKKVSLLFVILLSFVFQSSTSDMKPPQGAVVVSIQGIQGHYPADWPTGYTIWLRKVGGGIDVLTYKPAIANTSVYIFYGTESTTYYCFYPSIKKNDVTIPKEITDGCGYLDEDVPIYTSIKWADEE
jgi:hypothetical protein